ncbi:hypothetical protein DYBT9275_03124 [Dyadobacter sp. CECT 9275]|uniref:SD-repeat containing protein B domain-containing protein n=1 Tax=Dyadobacter helix TaxID=2822344 RepID=A0A916JH14_9BACT|nr:SdrD B-like domain-containing protein [Dyadobacter sp. CECT 9275]CAG5003307.1 hypothetical protein DYBT9275_03124 [Dyadobacter sp. CECT 9275]
MLTLILTAIGPCQSHSIAQITGQTWQDVNANGVLDDTEATQAQMNVTAYDGQGKRIASAVTYANGAYVLDVPPGQRVRRSLGNLSEVHMFYLRWIKVLIHSSPFCKTRRQISPLTTGWQNL